MRYNLITLVSTSLILFMSSCNQQGKVENEEMEKSPFEEKVNEYANFTLTSDLSHLSEKEKQLVGVFIDIAEVMDDLFWLQTFGDKSVLDTISDDWAKKFVNINYGPWDRLDEMKPFIDGWGAKPDGACFYPTDMTKQEFDALTDTNKNSPYTVIVRGKDGKLEVVWYKDFYKTHLQKVEKLMQKAIELAENQQLKHYLEERLKAFQTDEYFASDLAWMDMKTSNLDFVVGPIESYEDGINGVKTAYEACILIKDLEWSNKLGKYIAMLPDLQKGLPCPAEYKKETPGTSSDLNVYDIVYYAGDCNSGGKTIAINLPNDERVHLQKGSRRIQLKNTIRAKFDIISLPIAELLLADEYKSHITFDAFFNNVMFHEVAHGLGIKNLVKGKGTVKDALKQYHSAYEEAKADILGLYMVENLINKGELQGVSIEDAYITFIAGMFRSIRFGAAEAHGQANMMCLNYFAQKGAFTRDNEGKYHVDMPKAQLAAKEWAETLLKIQGNGDFAYAEKYLKDNTVISKEMKSDLQRISDAKIPRDIVFTQGKKVLGLDK
ncbi:MAG: Zn-dependent hydrolase [Bacteroidales bacterium]|jgi:hypothetical protein|nr:Zn-dependent hydrolase [Bacteroidales bacterium]